MIAALFVSFNIGHFYPKGVVATMCFLQKIGCLVKFLMNRAYFGQPITKPDFVYLAIKCDTKFIKIFKGHDYIADSVGSCVLHIKNTLNYPIARRRSINTERRVCIERFY